MNITKIERYKLEGQEFRSLEGAKRHVEDEIGKILDKTPFRMAPQQALDVFQAIVDNKERLRELLGVYVDLGEDDDEEQRTVNILDL